MRHACFCVLCVCALVDYNRERFFATFLGEHTDTIPATHSEAKPETAPERKREVLGETGGAVVQGVDKTIEEPSLLMRGPTQGQNVKSTTHDRPAPEVNDSDGVEAKEGVSVSLQGTQDVQSHAEGQASLWQADHHLCAESQMTFNLYLGFKNS